tara:strand:- start:1254 stop:2396 length:1143 start_codon:yes stop_codon:yes gene_type:complete
MKKILVVNTTYSQFGGEDSNIVDEIKLLQKNFDVEYLEYKNSQKLNFYDFIAFFLGSNYLSNKLLKLKLKEFEPDVVYVHNTWFKANLGIFKILKKSNTKVLVKIHNFRYYCTRHFFIVRHLENQDTCKMCNLSKGKKILNKYFQDSYLKSFFVIIYGKKYYKIIKNYGFQILVMTRFQKTILENLGFNSNNINIYFNPINVIDSSFNSDSDYFVYAGRISTEKGTEELIKAFIETKLKNINLKLIGDGKNLENLKDKYNLPNINFLGELDNNSTMEVIRNSRGVITATKMYEGQPRLLCEASSMKIPAVFPKFGGMSEFYPDGYEFIFEQYDYADLSSKIIQLYEHKNIKHISKNVFEKAVSLFDEKTMVNKFYDILSK